ncbi:MAG: hypothetical protein Q8R47_05230 [Nanoarchaeota archaeon]|nr:hypothetical protein [Nanoarchaeota archaeon]
MRLQKIGLVIVVASIIVLGLLIFLKFQTDRQMLTACEESCGELGGVSCSLDSCPYHQGNNLSWVLIVMSILVAFIGGTGIYLSLPKKTEIIIEEKEYDLSSLVDEEKKIFLFIKDHKEGVYQNQIVKDFDLSKVQTTRLIDKLEGSGLVERKRRGLANVVKVK